MPLLDYFHAPLAPTRHWESFHVDWAGAIADALNEHLLPDGYFAEEYMHSIAWCKRVEGTRGRDSLPAPRAVWEWIGRWDTQGDF